MKILAVDIGTGTQDILLFNSELDVENSFKMVQPSPTMMAHRRLKDATRRGVPVVLTGVTMGGGPSQWAAEAHLKSGYTVYATPDAARSFNDDLDVVREMGIQIVSDDEVDSLNSEVFRLELKDFDFNAISRAFRNFDISLTDLDAVAVAVFDHGAAPPGYSDRQFRFDYIAERVRADRKLSTFAFLKDDIPGIMTRMEAVAATSGDFDAPLLLMDTAPAAVLGAAQDDHIRNVGHFLLVNVGNFHTIAFRMGDEGIDGVFEHHTGLLTTEKLDQLLMSLAAGILRHEDVFLDHGHGALTLTSKTLPLSVGSFGVAVTGPRRAMLKKSSLRPYFATPYGDMMMAGCYGLLRAAGDLLPEYKGEILMALEYASEKPPWE